MRARSAYVAPSPSVKTATAAVTLLWFLTALGLAYMAYSVSLFDGPYQRLALWCMGTATAGPAVIGVFAYCGRLRKTGIGFLIAALAAGGLLVRPALAFYA
ncbi:hypothetical protein [Phytomonospora endophytica]|uniref:Uncharacterized protein n=1 Tax=Phytomonospora endophytica TaxID=714109 RepID=A0A841FNU4_9ACTN|nr:hypothetical protein [Phytomonospora endophytica]MBB6036543.1 hypothetical protein [Phytomonospora endophytica]